MINLRVVVHRCPEVPTAPKGSPEAFGLFWIDQYGWIGLTLLVGGLVAVLVGVLR